MMSIGSKLLRPDLRELAPYASRQTSGHAASDIYLDANESPFTGVRGTSLNRYPDPTCEELRKLVSVQKQVDPKQIIFGNGSDEIIDMLPRVFCRPGVDEVLDMPPTFDSIYDSRAILSGAIVRKVPLTSDFDIDVAGVLAVTSEKTKITYICSPNSPSANCMSPDRVERIIKNSPGLVVLDEAYIDFSPEKSWLPRIREFSNLFVLQTLSKGQGLAGIRLGMGFGDASVIEALEIARPPYNINTLSQQLAFEILSSGRDYQEKIEIILSEKRRLRSELAANPLVITVFPSDANFLLVKFRDASSVYAELLERGIHVKDRTRELACENCLRITVGNPEENSRLLQALDQISRGK